MALTHLRKEAGTWIVPAVSLVDCDVTLVSEQAPQSVAGNLL